MGETAERVVIFLDVDGVLNSLRSVVAFGGCARPDQLDPVAIGLLNRLCCALRGAGVSPAVVISSTWRQLYPEPSWWNVFFRSGGWAEIKVIGITGQRRDLDARRGRECRDWLESNGSPPFVCLDDDSDFLPDQPLVHTSFDDGLQLRHIDEAFRYLTGKPMPGLPRIFNAPSPALAEPS